MQFLLEILIAQENQGGNSNIWGTVLSFLPFVLIFVIFYFLLIYPESKKRKQHQKMVEALKKDDKIITTGGIHGIVKNVKKNIITVKIADKVDVEIDRSAVVRVITKEPTEVS